MVLLERDEFKRINKTPGLRTHWHCIRAFGETSASRPFPKRMFDTVNEKSYIIFITQDHRRFIPALIFDSSGSFSLTVTDCQGQLRMAMMSLLARKDCALVLLKILAFLMYSSVSDVGLDSTMTCGPDGKIKSIFVNGKKFIVLRRIYALQVLIGQGTKIWIVERDG